MENPTKEQMQADQTDKLKNASASITALKICQIFYSDCIANKEIDSVLTMVKLIIGMQNEAIPPKYW